MSYTTLEHGVEASKSTFTHWIGKSILFIRVCIQIVVLLNMHTIHLKKYLIVKAVVDIYFVFSLKHSQPLRPFAVTNLADATGKK